MSTFALRRVAAATVLALSSVSAAQAASISVSLGDYNGPSINAGFPIDLGVVGTFIFALPANVTINSATFSGTWGTQAFAGSTAGFDVEIEGDTLSICVINEPCWNGAGSLVPFSFALDVSSYAGLLDGSADLRVIQTSGFNVRLGTPTLTIDYELNNAVPLPSTLALAGLGVFGLAATARQRRA